MITSAERARHAAWVTGSHPAWSPHLTAGSLRHVAATSTVTSHHCEILLRSLADRTAGSGTAGLSAGLLRAADAAGRTRDSWLHLARALNQVDTDTMRHLAPGAGEAGDLALCTGRLSYADPAWTLSSRPGRQPRSPQDLAPHPGDVPLALAAAHHACDALTSQAYAQRERIRTAAGAGRLLVPTRSLPDTMDVPRPLRPCPSRPCPCPAPPVPGNRRGGRRSIRSGRRGGRGRPGPQPPADRRQGRGPRRPPCQPEPSAPGRTPTSPHWRPA